MGRPRKQYRVAKHRRRDPETREIRKSNKYDIFFKDHEGCSRRITGHVERSRSERLAENILALVDAKASNLPPTKDVRDVIQNQPKTIQEKLLDLGILDKRIRYGFDPLMEVGKEKKKPRRSSKRVFDVTGGHLADHQKYLEAREYSQGHVRQTIQRVAKILDGCRFCKATDIEALAVEHFLSELRESGCSIRTRNLYRSALKSFVHWMVDNKRLSEDPTTNLKTLHDTEGRVYKRRALTKVEVEVLLATTRQGKPHHGLTGPERHLLYSLAVGSGLRWNEIVTLERQDIRTETEPPTVTVRATNAKSGKMGTVPLKGSLATALAAYFDQHPAESNERAFAGI